MNIRTEHQQLVERLTMMSPLTLDGLSQHLDWLAEHEPSALNLGVPDIAVITAWGMSVAIKPQVLAEVLLPVFAHPLKRTYLKLPQYTGLYDDLTHLKNNRPSSLWNPALGIQAMTLLTVLFAKFDDYTQLHNTQHHDLPQLQKQQPQSPR